MRKFEVLSVACVLALLSLQSLSAERLTRQQLLELRQQAKEQSKKSELLGNRESLPASKHPSQTSILESSLILSYRNQWTFVPKGSVLLVPEHYQDRVEAVQKGKYVPFSSFLRSNRSWLSTYNVTLEQARGKKPLNEKAVEGLVTAGRVVITVFKGGPITTRAYQDPAATAHTKASQ